MTLLQPRPSWAQGFARNASESIAPSLWRGMVGGWCASLGPTGDHIIDLSGKGHNGSLTGITAANLWQVTDGGAGWAFAFVAGNDDHISISLFPHTATRTWMGWWKPTGLVQFMSYMSTWNGSTEIPSMATASGAGSDLQIQDENSIDTPDFLVVDTWFHIAYTNDATGAGDGQSVAYVDGVVADTGTDPLNNSGTVTLTLGGTLNEFAENWRGFVDDVRVYDRALSQEEVQLSMNLGPGGIYIPRKTRSYAVPAAAPGGLSIPVAMANYRRRHEMRI